MINFWDRGELMTEWEPSVCSSPGYADAIVEVCRANKSEKSNVLMLGLGGGAIGALLSDAFHVTVLEKYADVVKKAKLHMYPHFRTCGLKPDLMNIVIRDAFEPMTSVSSNGFDMIIQDIPPCYKGESAIPLRNCAEVARSDALLICNFHTLHACEMIMQEVKDLWIVKFVKPVENQYICVAQREWPALVKVSDIFVYRGIQDNYTFQLLDGGTVVDPKPYQSTEFQKVLNGGQSDDITKVDDVYYWISRQSRIPSAIWLPIYSPKPTSRITVLVLLDGFRDGPYILRNTQMIIKQVEIGRRLSYTYPPDWSRSIAWSNKTPTHNNDLFAFGMNTASRAAYSSDCIVCGSRGGQATLIGIWRSGCHKPAIVINAGCSSLGLVWDNGKQPVVLIAGGRDFFKGHRTDDEYFNNLWDAIPSENKDTTTLVYFDHMSHKMSSRFAEYIVPICIEFCLSCKMHDDSIVAEFVSKIKRADTGKLKTNHQYLHF